MLPWLSKKKRISEKEKENSHWHTLPEGSMWTKKKYKKKKNPTSQTHAINKQIL